MKNAEPGALPAQVKPIFLNVAHVVLLGCHSAALTRLLSHTSAMKRL
jgi:hypothetical protein